MQTRKHYSKEFKQGAIRLVLDQGYSRAEAGRLQRKSSRRWLYLLMQQSTAAKIKNMADNITADLIAPVEIIAQK